MNTHEKSGLDGVGLWNSFTRSFTSPMLAMFDLIDNSFDAAPPETGHIHIDFEVDEHGNKTGLSLVNDCKEPVGPLSEVLTLFKSSKSTETEKIGENGGEFEFLLKFRLRKLFFSLLVADKFNPLHRLSSLLHRLQRNWAE